MSRELLTYRWWREKGEIGKRIVFVRSVVFVWLV